MTSILLALGVFILLAATSLTALHLHPRLPDHQRNDRTHDAVKVGVGMVVVLSALVLGLLVASAKNTFDTATRDLRRFSTQIVLLDRTLRAYGPEAASARSLIEHYLERALAGTWPTDQNPAIVEDPQAEQLLYQLQSAILAFMPEDPRKRALSDELKTEVRRLIELRWTLVEEAAESPNIPLLSVLLIWLMLVFASFGYNAPRNGVVTVTFVLCAASIGGALFLVIQMSQPFDGLIKVSPAPLQNTLAHVRQ
ncbi:MAG: hypothetical protein JO299_02815 [Gammaproteobacteria bacterium]|nr:hypothetical protein [Gammaproteobacteria bacterium]